MAKGQAFDKNNPGVWNSHVFYQWGKVAGRLHYLTKEYTPADGINKRSEFQPRDMINKNLKTFPSINRIAENCFIQSGV